MMKQLRFADGLILTLILVIVASLALLNHLPVSITATLGGFGVLFGAASILKSRF